MSEPGSLIRTLSGRQSARNFHSYVINEVGLAIVSGAMPVSSILPNDAEMMDRFGVSRTVLREALKTLEAKGLVEARAKVGTRVLPQARWSLFDRQVLSWALEGGPSPALVRSFLVVRRSLEAEAAALAAVHRDNESMRLLHYWLNQRSLMAEQPEPFALAEFEIHRGIAETTANPEPRRGARVADSSLSPRSSPIALTLSKPSSPAPALVNSIVPATAPAPNAPEPPPRVTRAEASRSGARADSGTKPKNGSAIGTPSSMTRLRLVALPPSARKVTPCADGLAERLSDRRNCWKPATPDSASSIRPEAADCKAARSKVWTS